jgi:hypothetical protein
VGSPPVWVSTTTIFSTELAFIRGENMHSALGIVLSAKPALT